MILRPQPPRERGGTGTLGESVKLRVHGGVGHEIHQLGDILVGVLRNRETAGIVGVATAVPGPVADSLASKLVSILQQNRIK